MSTRAPPHRRPAHRAAWTGPAAGLVKGLAAALALLAWPGSAAAGPQDKATAIAIYLPNTDLLTKDEAADVEAVLVSGLAQAARGGNISVRPGGILRPSCGRNPSDACLGALAGDGAVLVSRARRDGVHVAISMALVNGQGRRTRWTTFTTTLSVQDARPAAQALFYLEDELSRPGGTYAAAPGRAPVAPKPAVTEAERPAPKPPVAAPSPEPEPVRAPAVLAAPPPPVAAAPPARSEPRPAPEPKPDLKPAPPEPAPRPFVVRAPPPAPPPPPAGTWSAGRWAGLVTASAGVVVAGIGGYAALHARSLDARLTDRFDAGTLTPADAATYGSVRRWNRTGNVLLLTGGAVAAGGATIFFLSPVAGGGVSAGVGGRF